MASWIVGRIHPEFPLQPVSALKTPDILRVPLNKERLLLVIGDGHFVDGAFALYGMRAAVLGPLGTSVGWCLFQIFMIMVATLYRVF
jgi:hypothetical protein